MSSTRLDPAPDSKRRQYSSRSPQHVSSRLESPPRSVVHPHRRAFKMGLQLQHDERQRSPVAGGFRHDTFNPRPPEADRRHVVHVHPYQRDIQNRLRPGDETTPQHQSSHTQSLLMFGDDPSTVTGWSDQALLNDHAKKNVVRKDRSKYKKKRGKKKKEVRVLNLPPSLSLRSSPRNKYSREVDEPQGEKLPATRAVPKSPQHGRIRNSFRKTRSRPDGNSRFNNARITRSMSRSSEEASSTGPSSQGSPDFQQIDNYRLHTSPLPGSNTVSGIGRNRESYFRRSLDSRYAVHHSTKSPFHAVSESISKNVHKEVPSTNTHIIGPHPGEKDEEASLSSFPLLSTDATGQQLYTNPFSSELRLLEESSDSRSSPETVSTASVKELLDGSFPSPNRGFNNVGRAIREQAMLRSEEGNNEAEPKPQPVVETQLLMPTQTKDNERRFAVPSINQADFNNAKATGSNGTQAKGSPTSVIHLQQSEPAPDVGRRPKTKDYRNLSGQTQHSRPRATLKSILRTRRVVVDCPSDEGGRIVEQKDVEKKVRIISPLDGDTTPQSPRLEADNEFRERNGSPLYLTKQSSTIQHYPGAPVGMSETLPDQSMGAGGSDFNERLLDYNQFSRINHGQLKLGIDEDVIYESDPEENRGFFEAVAAVVIQTAVRRFLAVISFKRQCLAVNSTNIVFEKETPLDTLESSSFEDLAVRMYELAAIRVQSVFRGWWVRDSLQMDHFCATMIQRLVRGYICRLNYRFQLYCIVLIQNVWRRKAALNASASRMAHIIVAQAAFRGYKARKDYDTMVSSRRHSAATVIQAKWRSHDTYTRYIHTLADILIIQSLARRWIAKSRLLPYLRAHKNKLAQTG